MLAWEGWDLDLDLDLDHVEMRCACVDDVYRYARRVPIRYIGEERRVRCMVPWLEELDLRNQDV